MSANSASLANASRSTAAYSPQQKQWELTPKLHKFQGLPMKSQNNAEPMLVNINWARAHNDQGKTAGRVDESQRIMLWLTRDRFDDFEGSYWNGKEQGNVAPANSWMEYTEEARTCEAWFQVTFRPQKWNLKAHMWYQLSPFPSSNGQGIIRARKSRSHVHAETFL